MKKKYMDCISGAVLILFALWGWYETSTWKVSAASGSLSPRVYPRAVFTCILICGAIILGRTLFKMFLSKKDSAAELDRMIDMHFLTLIYIFALRAFGFLFTTPVFLFLAMLLFGERKWLRMVIISIVGTAVLYLFFVQIMSVRF